MIVKRIYFDIYCTENNDEYFRLRLDHDGLLESIKTGALYIATETDKFGNILAIKEF